MRRLSLLTALWACQAAAPRPTAEPPGEGFVYDTSVRILTPHDGETLRGVVTFVAALGSAVSRAELLLGDTVLESPDHDRPINLALEPGRHGLTLRGLDDAGDVTAEHAIFVRVVADGVPWITVMSPHPGATLADPVTFIVEASPEVDRIAVVLDDEVAAEGAPGSPLSHRFERPGSTLTLEVQGLQGAEVIAAESLSIDLMAADTPEGTFAAQVVEALEAYPTDGTHGYHWPRGGTWAGNTHDIFYLGDLFAAGDPQGRCYCVGLTFETFVTAAENAGGVDRDGAIGGMSWGQFTRFRTDWYVREVGGRGPADALENRGMGGAVPSFDDAVSGDFVQFWRFSGSGHNGVFIDWIVDGIGERLGMSYWSTQNSTDGIGYNDEYFGTWGASVNPAKVFLARPSMPATWID